MCIAHRNIYLSLSSLYNAKIISVAINITKKILIYSKNYNTGKNKGLYYKEFNNSKQLLYQKWESKRQDTIDPKKLKNKDNNIYF